MCTTSAVGKAIAHGEGRETRASRPAGLENSIRLDKKHGDGGDIVPDGRNGRHVLFVKSR